MFLEKLAAALTALRADLEVTLGDTGTLGLAALRKVHQAPAASLSAAEMAAIGAVTVSLMRTYDPVAVGYWLGVLAEADV